MGLASFIENIIELKATTTLFYFILTIGAVSLLVLSVVAGLFKSVFGRELAVGSSRVIVVADSEPDHIEATVVTLNAVIVPALRHSVYETDLAPHVIALWMRHKKIPNHFVKIVEDSKDVTLNIDVRCVSRLLNQLQLAMSEKGRSPPFQCELMRGPHGGRSSSIGRY